ncbi:hypothetical protein [Rhizobium sp. BK176]|uniref:hypothetical protein n=1 Tax=Rhizobium sp. BK176 TaxID=2587071 RepID=UPI002168E672|nr:hypothetical protein [Rhizobium sp. BK176]MCS4089879.1 hypothetical protein [Rhizobium sp. BK176]
MRYLRKAFADALSSKVPGAPETFSTEWPSRPGWTSANLDIHEVYYEFDEPVFFSVNAGPMLLLLQKAAERGGNLMFGPMVAPEVAEAMMENRISVRAAMMAGPIHVLEMDGLRVVRHWHVPQASVPSSWWPTTGTCLSSYGKIATDTPSFAHGRTGLRLVEGKAAPGDGALEIRGDGFDLRIAPGASGCQSLWGFMAGLLPGVRKVRHLNRGSDYDVMREEVSVQTSRPIQEGDVLTVYVEPDGRGWARLRDEFNDGRFETL